MTTFLFVGERPSQLAARIGATWENGKLAGRTLRAALEAAGLDPSAHTYRNLWTQPQPGPQDAADEAAALAEIRTRAAAGLVVVGMGQLVSRALTAAGITHLQLIHPAARGAIRKRERYQAHAQAVLGGAR